MPFRYPSEPHQRKHGPTGYDDYRSYKPWLRDEFSFRCIYCLSRERWYPDGQDSFCVEHLLPKSTPEYAHLEWWYDNLVYACRRCNSAKGKAILADPCRQAAFGLHLKVLPDGTIDWLTEDGMNLVLVLRLNDPEMVALRAKYIELLALWRSHPEDAAVTTWARRGVRLPRRFT